MVIFKFGWLKNGPAQIWAGSKMGLLKFGLAQIWPLKFGRSNLATHIWPTQICLAQKWGEIGISPDDGIAVEIFDQF